MAMNSIGKKIASKLPRSLQNELKRIQFGIEIRRGRFFTDEKEYGLLDQWVTTGDWVLDIGANIGHYSARLSDLVGQSGRVISFEPVPTTFELLAANMARIRYSNVTLMNIAASDRTDIVGMSIPKFETGLDNFYMAHVSDDSTDLQIMTAAIDDLNIPKKVKLIKIDAEGHEFPILQGMRRLLERDHPLLIVEDHTDKVAELLGSMNYTHTQIESSSNRIFE